jgi:hypothetical protein
MKRVTQIYLGVAILSFNIVKQFSELASHAERHSKSYYFSIVLDIKVIFYRKDGGVDPEPQSPTPFFSHSTIPTSNPWFRTT